MSPARLTIPRSPTVRMALSPSFSGHETFPLRFPWLAKAVEAVESDPFVFGDEAAIATFGVGRNMVRAIRHWGLATGVLEPHPSQRGAVVATAFGRQIFGAEGADPYCEDLATLWLLHWQLCRDGNRATLWHFIFGYWRSGALDPHSIQAGLESWLAQYEASLPSASTLKRDLLCLLNTYTVPSLAKQDFEDAVACPLASLGLVGQNAGTFYLREGRKRGLSPEVFAYVILDYWDRQRPEAETLDVRMAFEAPGSPGRIFLLGEEQAFELIEGVRDLPGPPFIYDATAGIQQLYRADRIDPAVLLRAYSGAVLA